MNTPKRQRLPPKVIKDPAFPPGSHPHAGGINARIYKGWCYHWESPQASRNWAGGWVRSRLAQQEDFASPRHTAGRLTTDRHSIGFAAGTVAQMYRPGDGSGRGLTQEEQEANAVRLVACWNACIGINPEAVPDLLAACKAMLNTPAMNADEMDPIEIEAVELARAAIAKAKGHE